MSLDSQLRKEVYDRFIYYTQLHLPEQRVEEALRKFGATDEELFFVRNHFVVEKARSKHTRGLTLTIVGSILLVAGFIITAVLYHQDAPFEAVMYGFTAVGLALLIWGVKDLF